MSDGRPMTVDALAEVLSISRQDDTTFTAAIADGWQQGRGAFGGLVLGLLARAIEQVEPDPARTLRTLSGEILAPVLAEPAEVRVEVLRRGSGMSSVAARLYQQGELRAHATALHAKARVADREYLGTQPPPAADWEGVEPFPIAPPLGPDFARAFEFRSTGPLPLSGGSEWVTEGFIRPKTPPAKLGAPELIAYIDAWWPTAYGAEDTLRPMATVSFNLQLLMDPSTLPTDAPLRFRARSLGAHDGFIAEHRELWTLDGRLVALNPQTFVFIR